MELTINIKCKEYLIKHPRSYDIMTSMKIPLPSKYIGKEMLIIPIIDDLIIIREREYGYFISVCGLEMYKKTVITHNKKHPTKGGRIYVPNSWVGCEVLLIPLDEYDDENKNFINDEV